MSMSSVLISTLFAASAIAVGAPTSARAGEPGETDGYTRPVSSIAELLAAIGDPNVRDIVVTADISEVPMLRLAPTQRLLGQHAGLAIAFQPGVDGLQLSTDNRVADLTLVTEPGRRALFNDTTVERLGVLELRDLRITGTVRLLASDKVRGGHIEAHDVHIVAADARDYDRRPAGYGVEVVPGAFMLWNQQDDAAVTITADMTGLSVGQAGAPVHGSGIFVAGAGEKGGRLIVRRLETGAVYSDGGIAAGTPDRISGGVFTVTGAIVDTVRNRGPVTTYGPNDMVLDNWGVVESWIAEEKITSFGPSAIGFVNFGTVTTLKVKAPIETFGLGARGFNVYAGTVLDAEFERVVTRADGAVGIQISQPIGRLVVHHGIATYGGIGESLVKGVVTKLPATALSVKPGGTAREIVVGGGVTTHGSGIEAIELHGRIEALNITDGVAVEGGGFQAFAR
jgi:hypothetical protein